MTVVLAVCILLVAVIYLYDAKRALWPMLPGEQGWRRGRVVGTTTALVAMSVLHRGAGPLWARGIAVVALLLSLAVVLRCSIRLKRLVAGALLYRREGRQESG
jgi:peptidoglycan/LPS O-acetylase OafA/YrhL